MDGCFCVLHLGVELPLKSRVAPQCFQHLETDFTPFPPGTVFSQGGFGCSFRFNLLIHTPVSSNSLLSPLNSCLQTILL